MIQLYIYLTTTELYILHNGYNQENIKFKNIKKIIKLNKLYKKENRKINGN